jgi:hypothetical protein
MDEPNVSADDFERAFCEAVQRYAAEEWTPAIPDQRMILVARAESDQVEAYPDFLK